MGKQEGGEEYPHPAAHPRRHWVSVVSRGKVSSQGAGDRGQRAGAGRQGESNRQVTAGSRSSSCTAVLCHIVHLSLHPSSPLPPPLHPSTPAWPPHRSSILVSFYHLILVRPSRPLVTLVAAARVNQCEGCPLTCTCLCAAVICLIV